MQVNPPIYCEAIPTGLVRTNAPEHQVNQAVATLLNETRRPADNAERALVESDYRESTDAWFGKPDLFGSTQERACRLVRRQIGRDGLPMSVEILHTDQMPTLVFVQHESRESTASLVTRLAHELARQGVNPI